jgi:hypothetical protein
MPLKRRIRGTLRHRRRPLLVEDLAAENSPHNSQYLRDLGVIRPNKNTTCSYKVFVVYRDVEDCVSNQSPGIVEPKVVTFELVRGKIARDSLSWEEKIAIPPSNPTVVSQFVR